ncbi:MAG TPA: galactose-1-phosphate uridylyltransferase [Patescibacteria group bacterium]|nr:galactose-1-phosphate uridylyltransferase [Patescibacteria group bacterium]
MPELRQNIITGDWVVIAPERAKRPQDFIIPKSVKVSDKTKCPFCVDSEGFKANKKNMKADYKDIYVIDNRFPAFIEDESKKSVRSFYPEKGFYRARASVGDHEVIVVKDHDVDLLTFPPKLLDELFEVMRERFVWIKENEKVVSIMPIYNHGAEAGASIDHPHAQIFASGIISNTIGEEINGSDTYYGVNGACIYCDIIKHELKEKIRVIAENEDFVAIEFFASRFPFETWVLPKHHESQFELTSKQSMQRFSEVVYKTLQMLNKTIDNPPLNWYIHTLPVIHEDSASYHWHMEILPRVSNFGGFELGSEVIINVMSPEEAAHYLKSPKRD